jgi:V8-like Glu-specific endopeptidase
MCAIGIMGMVSFAVGIDTLAAQAQGELHGGVTVLTVPSAEAQLPLDIDFVNAQALELPIAPSRSEAERQTDMIETLLSPPFLGVPGYAPGEAGDGTSTLIMLGVPRVSTTHAAPPAGDVTSQAFGTDTHPFSTAQADLSSPTNTDYPYRASGKLFFNIGTSTYACSASLIKRGVVVTAAHCVAEFGQGQSYANWHFVPGYRNGDAPYGVWTVHTVAVPTTYDDGTGPCAVAGVVCQDDVAVLLLHPSTTGAYPGTSTGWYGYGYDGYGFTGSGTTQIAQLGYPGCLDNGVYMERNDSYGYQSASNANNTIIGSLMCEGSSGGPWLVNFGIRPTLTGTTAGTAPASNMVVGVTSWGSTSTGPKTQGASPFLSTNIVPLVNAVCTAVPAACS